MTEIFINATNRVYILYYSLVIAIVLFVTIGTPIARYITGNQALELVPDSLYKFVIEVGKPIVYPVMIVVIGPLLEPATKFLIAFRGGKSEQEKPAPKNKETENETA